VFKTAVILEPGNWQAGGPIPKRQEWALDELLEILSLGCHGAADHPIQSGLPRHSQYFTQKVCLRCFLCARQSAKCFMTPNGCNPPPSCSRVLACDQWPILPQSPPALLTTCNHLVTLLLVYPTRLRLNQGKGPHLSCQDLAQAGSTCGMNFWIRWPCPADDWPGAQVPHSDRGRGLRIF